MPEEGKREKSCVALSFLNLPANRTEGQALSFLGGGNARLCRAGLFGTEKYYENLLTI
jgi:hypothetical protein